MIFLNIAMAFLSCECGQINEGMRKAGGLAFEVSTVQVPGGTLY